MEFSIQMYKQCILSRSLMIYTLMHIYIYNRHTVWHFVCVRVCVSVVKESVCMLNHIQLFVTLWTIAHQAPLSMGFSRQECWSGLSFYSPGIKPTSSMYPSLEDIFFTTELPGKTQEGERQSQKKKK